MNFGFYEGANKQAYQIIEEYINEYINHESDYILEIYTGGINENKKGDIYYINYEGGTSYNVKTESGKIKKKIKLQEIIDLLKTTFIDIINVYDDKNDKIIKSWYRPAYKIKLKEAYLHKVTDIPYEQNECAICLEPFGRRNLCRMSMCEHYFHKTCLTEYFIRNIKWNYRGKLPCPTCKTEGNLECDFKSKNYFGFGKKRLKVSLRSLLADIKFLSK